MKREIGVLVVLILVASAISMLSSGQPISPSQPPPGPEVYDLVVTAEPSAIPADGESTSTIIATVTNYSESPDGYTICFEIVGNSYGARISDKCDSTDEYGKAYTTLIAGETPGTVTVEACWSEYGRKVCNTTNVTLTGVSFHGREVPLMTPVSMAVLICALCVIASLSMRRMKTNK